MIQLNDPEKLAIDTASVGVILASIAGWLPTIAALLSIIWALIRIWETDTVREWTNRVKEKPPHGTDD